MERNVIIASTLEEAVGCKTPDAAFYAGGTEIGRLGSPVDAKTLILLKKIPELYGIRVTGDPETENPSGSWLRIGAMCSFQEILDCDAAPAWLKTAVRYLASLPRRFKATVGGNIASWRSDSYLIPTLLAAGAKLEIAGMEGGEDPDKNGNGAVPGRRILALKDYMEAFQNISPIQPRAMPICRLPWGRKGKITGSGWLWPAAGSMRPEFSAGAAPGRKPASGMICTEARNTNAIWRGSRWMNFMRG